MHTNAHRRVSQCVQYALFGDHFFLLANVRQPNEQQPHNHDRECRRNTLPPIGVEDEP